MINDGVATTNTRNVTLSFQAVSAIQMMIADDANFTGSLWETFAATKIWTLPDGDGVKTVYAKFRDIGSNVAGPVSDTIQLVIGGPGGEVLGAAEFRFTKDLAFGDTDTDVPELQKRLAKDGFYFGSATGSFDAATLQAVKAYQKAKNIVSTGYVGIKTRAELNKREAVVQTPVVSGAVGGIFARNLTLGVTGPDVRALQEKLTKDGFYNGPITGYFGQLTRAGVRKYQVAKSIAPAAGYVGPLTRVALNAAILPPAIAAPIPTPAPQTQVVQAPTPVNREEAQNKINALQAQLLNLLKLLEEARKAR